jgi:DNA-directed RNA polymerase subunit RPC12/RpoP
MRAPTCVFALPRGRVVEWFRGNLGRGCSMGSKEKYTCNDCGKSFNWSKHHGSSSPACKDCGSRNTRRETKKEKRERRGKG